MRNGTRYVLSWFVAYCLTALSMSTAMASSGEEPVHSRDIDAVWTESDGIRHELFYAARLAGQWSEPVMVTDDHFDNLHPALDRDSQGRIWLVWSAYDNQRMELRYTIGSDGVWQTSAVIPSAATINISPSLVIDKDDVAWLVWSANSGGLDDIYYAIHANGAWSEPAPLHGENDRTDVLPEIDINREGRPVVFWQGMVAGGYETFTSEYRNGSWSPEALVPPGDEEQAEAEEEELALPDFIEKNGAVFLRIY